MPAKQKSKTNPTKIEQIKPGHPDYLQPDTKRMLQLMDKDISPEDAAKLVKGKDKICRSTKEDLKKKHARYSLTKPKLVKLAHKAIEETLAMTEVNEVKPSYTNRLTAAQMVMDRVEPVVKVNHNLNVNANVDPVDLTAYMTKNCG